MQNGTLITAAPVSVEADGTTSSTVTVQLKDAAGANLTVANVPVLFSHSANGVYSSATALTDATGLATVTLTNLNVETDIVSAHVDLDADGIADAGEEVLNDVDGNFDGDVAVVFTIPVSSINLGRRCRMVP